MANFAPKLVAFLVILIIGWILAKLIAKAIDKVLEKVGFDRAVERGGVKKALARSSYDASTIVSKIIYYALLLVVLQLAFGVFGPNAISDLIAAVIAFLPQLLVAVIIIVVAAAIAAAVRDIVSNALSGLSYGRLLANIASIAIIGLGVIAALNQVGIALTVTLPVLVAILGTIGGILVVGVGGGLIKPMQQRWEDYLSRAENESRNVREQLSTRDQSTTAIPMGSASQAGYGQGAQGTQESGWPSAGQPGYGQSAPQYPSDPAGRPGSQGGSYPSGQPTGPYPSGPATGYDDPYGGRHTGMPGGSQYPYGDDRGGRR
ncbi:mechanosensitive ion channel family protein [Mycolicibacterium litorale]|uniref:mechanosensitive ion channel family protein n=1 Tax=Mycolicibacterium litorale TaxID=758802 RepID=UPI003CEFF81F